MVDKRFPEKYKQMVSSATVENMFQEKTTNLELSELTNTRVCSSGNDRQYDH